MLRATILLFALTTPVVTNGDPFRFEPFPPTSSTSVTVHVETLWGDSCLPRSARVTRDGQKLDVVWSTPRGVGCLTVLTPWSDRVPLGLLEPGVYEVTLRVDREIGVLTLGTKTLAVAEGTPAFQIVPSFVSVNGGVADLRSPDFCFSSAAPVTGVTVDGVSVPYNVDPCSIVIQLPAHAAGPVDVTVQANGNSYIVRGTLRYVDEHAAPDPYAFERVLLPTLTNGPGAFGSQWMTQARLRNLSGESLRWFSDAARPSGCSSDCRVGPFSATNLTEFGEHPKGLVLFVPRPIAEKTFFGLLVRDVSRDATDWGTEIRVIREKDARYGAMLLENVPFDSRYRLTLRVYAIDGGPSSVLVTAFVPNAAPFTKSIALDAACDTPPCNSRTPAFASADLGSLFPSLHGNATVSIEPSDGAGRPHWAFVSVTNNESQHVTTISPQ